MADPEFPMSAQWVGMSGVMDLYPTPAVLTSSGRHKREVLILLEYAFLLSLDDCKVEGALYIQSIFKRASIDRLLGTEGGKIYSPLSVKFSHRKVIPHMVLSSHQQGNNFIQISRSERIPHAGSCWLL